jgi:hypothetical protein
MITQRHLLSLTIALAFNLCLANTEVRTPNYLHHIADDSNTSYQAKSKHIQKIKYKEPLSIYLSNRLEIASNTLFWGRSLSGSQPGGASRTLLTAEVDHYYSFLALDLFNCKSSLSGSAATNTLASSGGLMSGTSIGSGVYLNPRKTLGAGLSLSIYQWPGQQWYRWTSTTALAPLNHDVKPVKTTNIQFMWHSFVLYYSIATTSDIQLYPSSPTATRWPHNWGDYIGLSTPSYSLSNNLFIGGKIEHWENTGDTISAHISRKLLDSTRGEFLTYYTSSSDSTIDDRFGFVIGLNFFYPQTIHKGT